MLGRCQSFTGTEKAELELERKELKAGREGEQKELMAIYVARELQPALAKQVAEQLMIHDAIRRHAQDELAFPKPSVHVRSKLH